MGRQSHKKKDRRRDRRSPEALLDYLDETLEVLAAEFTQVTFDYRDRVKLQAL